MFRKAKVGDRVWSSRKGWGTVEDAQNGTEYAIKVTFNHNKTYLTFTIEGKHHSSDIFPSLFWDEIQIVPPPMPKRKIKKWGAIYIDGDSFSTNADHVRIARNLKGELALASSEKQARNLMSNHEIVSVFPIMVEEDE